MAPAARIVIVKPVDKWTVLARQYRDTFDEILGSPQTMKIVHDALDKSSPEMRELADDVRRWIADSDARFSAAYGDDTQLAAFALIGRWVARDFPPRWAAASNLERALRLAIGAGKYVALDDQKGGLTLVPRTTGTPPDSAFMLSYRINRLAQLALHASLEERAHVVRSLSERKIDVTSFHPSAQLVIFQIAGDQKAIDDLALRTAEDPRVLAQVREVGMGYQSLLAATRSPEAFEKLLVAFPQGLQWGGTRYFAMAMPHVPAETIARCLTHAMDVLDGATLHTTPGDKKAVLQLAACVDDASIAAAIAARAHTKNAAVIAADYFERFPHHIGALESVVANGKGKLANALAPILDIVRRRHNAPPVSKKRKATKDAGQPERERKREDVPTLLAHPPPWLVASNANKETKAHEEIAIPDEPALHLHAGKYIAWVARYPHATDAQDQQHGKTPLSTDDVMAIATLRQLSDDVALQRLREDADAITWTRAQHLDGLMSRLGPASVPLLVRQAVKKPAVHADALLNVRSPRAAVALASLLSISKYGARVRAWLLMHADVAAVGLVAAATHDSDPKTKRVATEGLNVIASAKMQNAISAACTHLGVTPLPDEEELLATPGKLPKVANPQTLPAPVIAATGATLPREAIENLLRLLSVLPQRADHPFARELKCALTQDSLDAFVWTLALDWSLAGARVKDEWALYAVGHLGSDTVARKIDAQCIEWVKRGKVKVMQSALEVLAMIGTEVALSFLYERGLRTKFEDTGALARQLLEQVAQRRGITYDDLEDRLVPDLGLDDGPITLDYGSRTFTVKLDERLMPLVLDGESNRLDAPPRVTKKDNEAKAKAARARFDELRTDLERVAATQILRMESAMREARSWAFDDFMREVVHHPLLRHLATKLVWDVRDAREEVSQSLVRVAEDGTLADANDDAFLSNAAMRVRVAHPIEAPSKEEWTKMSKLFLDYEILQPFPQLSREVIDPSSIAKDATCTHYAGRTAAWSSVMELLTGKGWRRTPPIDGTVRELELPLDRFGVDGGAIAKLRMAPGLTIGPVKARPTQTLDLLELRGVTFAKLHPRAASEILRDVAMLNQG